MVKKYPDQGDIINIQGIDYKLLVISNATFNSAAGVIVCPIVNNEEEGALHIPVEGSRVKGIVLCEQLKYFNLKKRSFRTIDRISLFKLMDISDAIQGMIEYV